MPERALAGEETVRQGLVDEEDRRRPRPVPAGEVAAREERNPHGVEVARAYRAPGGGEPHRGQRRRAPEDGEGQRVTRAAERQRGDRRHLAHRGIRPESGEHRVQKGDLLRGLRIARLGETDPPGDQPRGAEAGIDLHQPGEALEHQPGADQERRGEGQLEDHEEAPGSVPARPSGGAPAAVLERFEEPAAPGLERRHQADGEAGQKRQSEGESEGHAVDSDLARPRQAGGDRGHREVGAPERQEHPPEAAGEGEGQSVGQHLAHQPPAAGAERGADGELALPGRGPGEQKVGDVGTGDQEDEGDRPQEHEEGGADTPGHDIVERFDLHAVAGVLPRVLLGQAGGDRHHLRPGAGGGGAGGEAPHDGEEMRPPAVQLVRREGHGKPELGLLFESGEAGGHDADHHRRLAVEPQTAAEDVRIAAEAPLPQPVRKNGDPLPGRSS